MTTMTQAQALLFARHANRKTCSPISGNLAVWAAILAGMSEFAVMFIVYFLAKVHHPEIFTNDPLKLNTLAGTINTLVILTSSFLVIRAVIAMRTGKPVISARWLWGAAISGGVYLFPDQIARWAMLK